MNGLPNINRVCAHLNSKTDLTNQIAGISAHNTATNNAMGAGIKE